MPSATLRHRRRQPSPPAIVAAVSTAKTVISGLGALKEIEGRSLGFSDWVPISQERIDAFAAATDDHQWIHTDVDRARRESPWKSTIAHGYLTLSLVPMLLAQLLEIRGVKTAINTGIEKLRLSAPVPAGSRLRMAAEVHRVRALPSGGLRVSFSVRVEVEATARPALLANVHYVYFDR
jgi:acyl dehydratase